MTPDKLDMVIKVSFATMVLGVSYAQAAPDSGGALTMLLWLVGMAGVAVAGFWRARLVRNAQMPSVVVGGPAVQLAIPLKDHAQRSETLRDLGLISFLLGLFLLNVAFFVLFVSQPAPNIAITGGVLTTLGALALAKRYRFFAVLVACFVIPVGIIGAFVVWPPVFWVLLALAFAWLLGRRWRRAHPRPQA